MLMARAISSSLVAATLSLVVTTNAVADCSGVACSNVKITALYIDGVASNWLSTSGTETSLSCTPDSGTLLKLNPSAAKSDWLYSLALSAYLTQQTVFVRTNASGPCEVIYVSSGSY